MNIKHLIQKNYKNINTIPKYCLFLVKGQYYLCIESKTNCIKAYKVFKEESKSDDHVQLHIDNKDYYIDKTKMYTFENIDKINSILQLPIAKVNQLLKGQSKVIKKDKYFVKVPIGTVYMDFDSQEYIYLYSNRSADYLISANEYIDYKNYPVCNLYQMSIRQLIRHGEASDEELIDILTDQIECGHDELDILNRKLELLTKESYA